MEEKETKAPGSAPTSTINLLDSAYRLLGKLTADVEEASHLDEKAPPEDLQPIGGPGDTLALLSSHFQALGAVHEELGHHLLASLGDQAEFTGQRLRVGGAVPSTKAIDILRACLDAFAAPSGDEDTSESIIVPLLHELNEFTKEHVSTADILSDQELFASEAALLLDTFREALDVIEANPDGTGEAVASAFRAMHTLKGNAAMIGDPHLEAVAREAEESLDGLRSFDLAPTRGLLAALRVLATEMLRRVQDPNYQIDEARTTERLIKAGNKAREVAEATRLGHLLVTEGGVSQEEIALAVAIKNEPLGESLVRLQALPADRLQTVLERQRALRTGVEETRPAPQHSASPPPFVSVDPNRLEALTRAVAHLLATIEQSGGLTPPSKPIARLESPGGASNSGNGGSGASSILSIPSTAQREATDLGIAVERTREALLALDEISLGPTLRRMSRLAFEVARKLNKKVETTIHGAEVAVPRRLLNEVSDALLHIVRNAVDHGIEAPDERARKGKCAFGSLTLSARTSENFVEVEVRDDGQGIDAEKVLEKAVTQGLIQRADANASDTELVTSLLFRPGFSIRSQVSSISGRGVGMDAVKQSVETIGGRVVLEFARESGTKVTLIVPKDSHPPHRPNSVADEPYADTAHGAR